MTYVSLDYCVYHFECTWFLVVYIGAHAKVFLNKVV
jgi:hypothetical protein